MTTETTAIVTGSSGGIGQAVALELAAMGMRLVLHCNRNADAAQALIQCIEQAGGEAHVFQGDLTDFGQA